MIKVLFLPLNYGEVVQRGVYDAFRDCGCDLQVFDYFYEYESCRKRSMTVRQKFINKAIEYQPDLIHMQLQHTRVIDDKTVAAVKRAVPKAKIVNWTGDVRNNVPITFKQISKVADYNLISSTGQLEMFRAETGRKVGYWQIGYDPKLYFASPIKRKSFDWDCVFIANNNTKEGYPGRTDREKVCRLLKAEFGDRFALFGHGWPRSYGSKGSIDQKKVASFYHRSLCSISVSHYNDLDHYFSDRLLMCVASGRPTISYRFPKWESYFTNNCDLIIAESTEDIVEKVKFLKKNSDFADYVGKSGAEKALAEHTYFTRIRELLDIVGLFI